MNRGETERERAERDDYVDCLPHPPFSLVFFPLVSSSIILPRSIASRHEKELTSTALCNTALPAQRKCCAPLEQLQSSCTNRNAPMRQASERLVFNPVVQDWKPHNPQSLQKRSYREESKWTGGMSVFEKLKRKWRRYLKSNFSYIGNQEWTLI